MLTWAHYRFRQSLFARTKRTGTVVQLVDEAYTSKTCGKCGNVHNGLGGAKTFHCPLCNHKVDRDANGARNILLRNAKAINFLTEGMALPPGALMYDLSIHFPDD